MLSVIVPDPANSKTELLIAALSGRLKLREPVGVKVTRSKKLVVTSSATLRVLSGSTNPTPSPAEMPADPPVTDSEPMPS